MVFGTLTPLPVTCEREVPSGYDHISVFRFSAKVCCCLLDFETSMLRGRFFFGTVC